jgi:hypothetical protein
MKRQEDFENTLQAQDDKITWSRLLGYIYSNNIRAFMVSVISLKMSIKG